MDPPSSFAAVESLSELSVVRGVPTLRYGAAPGTVIFDRRPAELADGSWWSLSAQAAAGSYFAGPAYGLDATVGSRRLAFQVSADRLHMESYSDGNGDEVPSAFDSRNGLLSVTWRPDELSSVTLSYEVNRVQDALYAGAGMDGLYSDNDAARMRFRRAAGPGAIGEIRADFYSSRVEHLMDNYSLRPLSAPMALRAPSTSDSTGGRLWTEIRASRGLQLTVGAELARNVRQALRFAGGSPDNVTTLQSVLWPEVDIEQSGLFVEGQAAVRPSATLRFGVRGDRHIASAAAADRRPAGMNLSPRQLWESYYPVAEDRWQADEPSGFVRYEHRFDDAGVGLAAGLSRTARAADSTQRYMASNAMAPAMRWVGNPNLEPAVHSQLDLGVSWLGADHSLEVSLFYGAVRDEILRDRAHGQSDILRDDDATVYRNVDVRRTGAELVGRWRLTRTLTIGGDAAWVRAQNTTDDRPVAQTPPLGGRLFAGWSAGRWSATGTVRWATRQTRVDDDPTTGSGLDVGETPGWAAVDLSTDCLLGAGFSITAGVDNLFDRAWANHLNRDNFFDPEPVQVNEPGRTLWLRLRWTGGG
jgi:iron complex outermembrane receptor protein